MSTTLDKLVNNLEPNQFNHIRQIFDDKQCELFLRKGYFDTIGLILLRN